MNILMNNILMNFFIHLIEYICGHQNNVQELSSEGYFLYDLETLEISSLYE